MRVPLSWLREYAAIPDDVSPRDVGDALIHVGLEVETVEEIDVVGPLVLGRVAGFVPETHTNGKTVRWCQVDVGDSGSVPGEPQGIVCGAANFEVGDHVVVALPGSVLPGGFAIASRRTYGHVSDGMICSARELGLGDDHDGIMIISSHDAADGVLPDVGADVRGLLGLPEAVLDIAVTPDRGYCLSVRGVAREAAAAFGVPFRDPADRSLPAITDRPAIQVRLDDTSGCDRFVARRVTGVDPAATSPLWLRSRLHLAGMRPLSLAVDVTNHVMLDLGQPIHGYDAARLQGGILVRRAVPPETLQTLDGTQRDLAAEDLLICDDSGPIGLAGVMGGTTTELLADTTEIVVEAAHFDAVSIARTARRHKLSSEASRRFERGVDTDLPAAAADLVVDMLVTLAGGRADERVTDVRRTSAVEPIELDLAFPGSLVGAPISADQVVTHLRTVGCEVTVDTPRPGLATVTPPSWRPDLVGPVYLVEEVIRLQGYDTIPATVPTAPASYRPNREVLRVNRISRALAFGGAVEIRNYPFISSSVLDALGLPEGARERRLVRLVNPISDEEPYLRTTLLPGLLSAAHRNVSRGLADVAVFEVGRVFVGLTDVEVGAPILRVDRPPTPAERAALDARLPEQPWRAGVVLTGRRERAGWWGPGRDATWADAVALARRACAAVDVPVDVRQSEEMPFHPGRCAEIIVGGQRVGLAGELHPRVVAALNLPARTCAMEIDLGVLASYEEPLDAAPHPSSFPAATIDIALVVSQDVAAAELEETIRRAGGELLEGLALFDVYTGEQVDAGKKSLAYSLRLRATDRTLTEPEISGVREAILAEAGSRHDAALRGA